MPADTVVQVQRLGTDGLIIRCEGLCEDPEFVERVVGSLARAARPGRRLDYRDELLRELAARHYVGSTAARAKQLLADVRCYETTRWRFDRAMGHLPAGARGHGPGGHLAGPEGVAALPGATAAAEHPAVFPMK